MTRTLKLTLAYDGGAFCGWQRQPNLPTVQGAMEEAFRRVTDEAIHVVGSGRTDSGVHALGQAASCVIEHSPIPTANVPRALNAVLPETIVVRDAVEMPAGFHAIRDAVRKRYRYVIYNARERDVFRRRYEWHFRQPLDAQRMHRAGQGIVGRHDFRSFQSSGDVREDSVRTIFELSVTCDPQIPHRIILEVEGDGFLYNMVRAITGTLIDVGRGVRDEAWPAQVVAARDRRAAGQTSPPHGLFLVEVHYAIQPLSETPPGA